MPWYAIRNVYHFGVKADGKNIFEERIVCFAAESATAAHKLAEVESRDYAISNNFVGHDEQVGYELDPDDLIQGHEVWSELFESLDSLEIFYQKRYLDYVYTPD
ncbi:hypothetical protein [Atopomonas hussainii]|uniref:hypothetical protein n=1 Tax=Atopomonas hussainii TaxID=1429083 RepID=UPI000944CD32|nr:hypothetical protein [Atopomonas hussainii]